ncbi:uncharacterized short protein YbdD (DUF466 family) [Novosphingobium fluoreni]|uniref:Uncharacterized short protein YbdD (DUF466 family) n=1 Tax=Novosphingobium fluoreni TaxID=1391222 RepID=A0A7W6FXE4_9SPHN|nr:YbdD/YjiX family protein [Novosphingobium fluoreni]MBB3939168.1 uncharacterized short protein YbdD (DUF466 family) [Novosphingobium fluoreni]
MALRDQLSLWAENAKVILGVPSYRLYREHMARHHPERALMSEAQFFRNRQDARYGKGGGGKCC